MSFSEILQKIDDVQSRKLALKVPEWKDIEINIPSSLNLEQCSSSATAKYKAEMICKRPGLHIADLTGGLGVDAFFFSKLSERVLYNERNQVLSEAVSENYKRLGVSNVEFCSFDAESEEMRSRLLEFHPDVIFMDPARRNGSGKKLFLLEDCSPNVLGIIPELLSLCGKITLKLSPMADITMLQNRLGPYLKEIHIIESGGECKELLCNIENKPVTQCNIVVSNIRDNLVFHIEEERNSKYQFAVPSVGDCLYEPGPALMKSGAFKLICQKFGLYSISPESHLFFCKDSEVRPLCKSFLIKEIIPFSGTSVKESGKCYPAAEVSARGIKMKSDELRRKLGVKSGGNIHIFGTVLDNSSKVLIITEVI